MKKFDTFENLWSYMSYCPICNDMSRKIEINIGPDDMFNIAYFQKENNSLLIDVLFRQSHYKHDYEIKINTLNNLIEVYKKNQSSRDIKEFYFYLYSNCNDCDSFSNSTDLEIKDNKISNIGIEQESISISKCKDKFYLSYHYDCNEMLIYRIIKNDHGFFVQDDLEFSSPIISFDFSNQDKVVEKIKTILLFS